MGMLFEQISGTTEHYFNKPVTMDTSIKASYDSRALGTGYLITVEAADPHVIQFVDRGVFTYGADYERVYSAMYSKVQYGLQGDSGKNMKKFSQKSSRQRYIDVPSDAKSPCVDMYDRIPCAKTEDKLQFYDAPGNTFSVTGGMPEQGEVGEFVAVTFCLSGNKLLKIIKWNLYWAAGRRQPSVDVRFKEPNQEDVVKYRGYLDADARWKGKGADYLADTATKTAKNYRVDSLF